MENNYYQQVKAYYDIDSENFESRYWENNTLQRIRSSFRTYTQQHDFQSLLEIGYGPGVDIIHFAQEYPQASVYGLDISEGMYQWASKQVQLKGLDNVNLAIGSVEDIKARFGNQQFDHIYVYFGALNTVEDIQKVQHLLKEVLKPDGKMTLTFVNKWYWMAILKPLFKLKFKKSVQRLRKTWGGYSPSKFLASKCYAYSDIKRYFNEFEILEKRGYSILFPAWYENRITLKYPKLCNFLWKVDAWLQKTPFWNSGEYSLYVMKKKV